MSSIVMTRDERQQLCMDKFIKSNGKGTLECCTAFGKTRVGLNIIRYLRRSDPERSVIIVVPNDYLKQQWTGLLVDAKLDRNTEVWIINSFIKSNHECSLLILDEIHRFAADTFSRVFGVTKYRFILGLTAILKRLDKKHGIISSFCPVIDKVTMEEARLYGFIAPYKEFNLGIEMDVATNEEYEKTEEYYNACMGTFQWDFVLMKRCLGSYKPHYSGTRILGSSCEALAREYGWRGNYPEDAMSALRRREKNFWGGDPDHPFHPSKLYLMAINGLRTMRKLKDILQKHPKKIDIAVEIINRFPDRKTITFAELVETAEEMNKKTALSAVYHSSMAVYDEKGKKLTKAKGKEYVTDLINQGKITRIHTARALDEGADFPDISLGIRISGSSSPTQQTQRRGRIVRLYKDKKAIMVNLYLKDTKEEQWLKKSQGSSKSIEWIDSIDELIKQVNE